jgi:hypothetical protein
MTASTPWSPPSAKENSFAVDVDDGNAAEQRSGAKRGA